MPVVKCSSRCWLLLSDFHGWLWFLLISEFVEIRQLVNNPVLDHQVGVCL
ncbi:hypothetical protein ACFFX0_03345 [Citricoccus parietis]|uniref:Uncharacterized protein n=1 Tax=Citricoccus parietis TaxID=592307 RepID=A0ABV5FUB0_9MICC